MGQGYCFRNLEKEGRGVVLTMVVCGEGLGHYHDNE